MAIMSIVAVLMSFALVAAGVGLATTDFGVFFSGVSFLIVFGLTLTAAFVGYQPRYVVEALKAIAGPFRKANVDRSVLTEETGRIIRWGYLVKKHGILALEREIKGAKNQDHFLNYGVELVITGYSADEVRGMLAAAADGYYQRAMVIVDILNAMASAAPAFGMLGTLIGLIAMLQGLGGDAAQLGLGLAVALITTLYGVLFARLLFMPAATQLKQKQGIQRFRNFLVSEGFALLADSASPRFIQDKMNSFLDPAIHYSIDKKEGQGGGKKRAA